MKRKRVRRAVGDVVAIDLGDRVAFGLVLDEPLMAFFDVSCPVGVDFSIEQMIRAPVAFRVWVMNQPIVDGTWPVIARVPVPEELREKPWFFKQDPISGEVTVGRTGDEELVPEPGQADTLERAAVWSASHVIDRLRDHFDGRPNRWVESMRIKRSSGGDESSR